MPQDLSVSHIHHFLYVGNVYMSPHPMQNITTFKPPESLQNTSLFHMNITPQLLLFYRTKNDQTLPSFMSPSPAADSQSLIEALTMEIEWLQKNWTN